MPSLTPIAVSDENEAAEIRAASAEGLVRSTARYLLRTEVHTFAFSVAANSILSFFPFLLLLMTLIRYVFHSQLMYGIVESLLRDYLPTGQEFVIRDVYKRQSQVSGISLSGRIRFSLLFVNL